MSDFTEADVEATRKILLEYGSQVWPEEVPEFLTKILAAVVPAMRDRWLDELDRSVVADTDAFNVDECHRFSNWILAQRSGGDQ